MLQGDLKRFGTVVFLIIVIMSSFAVGDVFMKQKHHTEGFKMMGHTQPAQDAIQSIWITPDKIRSDGEKQSFLVRMDKNVMYMIDHSKKTYMEMPANLGEMVASLKKDDQDEENAAEMQKMMKQMMQVKASVTATGEAKKIGNWNCKKYLQTLQTAMGPITSEIWATEDLKMDPELYAKFSTAMLAQQPGMKESMGDLVKEMKKIKGVAVLTNTTTTIMNNTVKSSTELLEFKDGKAPAGLFELPAGYAKKAFGQGMR